MEKFQTKPLSLTVYNADENSFGVASVLVSGENETILIDAQFTLSDAQKLVDEIKASGKKLTAVYVSHGDPDYYFGLEVIKRNFPEVTVYATSYTVEHIKKTSQKKLDVWGPKLNENGTKNIVLPQVLPANHLELEGHKIEIMGLEGDFPERTYVWIPSSKAILGGVNVFGNLHLWTADGASIEDRKKWTNSLNQMLDLKPQIVVPGHFKKRTVLDTTAIEFSKNYLASFETELAKADSSTALSDVMKKQFPNLGMTFSVELGAKVNKGEIKW